MQFVSRVRSIFRTSQVVVGVAGLALMVLGGSAVAQTGGEGAIEGTVMDKTGAVVANATVTATNVDTTVETAKPTSSGGIYDISPLIPGTYTITVTAKGFEKYVQDSMEIDAMHVTGLNITLKPGAASETVTVTDAPPVLETTNATLGGTIKSDEYMDLPLLVSGNQQRDITQFSNLLPGAQLNPGGRSSVVGGTAQRLGEEYLDGIALTTVTQQGDNRPVFNVVPMESISQIQVVTSGYSAEYEGAGLENYTLMSGTNQYHGTAADFIRNRMFDTWGFAAPWVKVVNSTCTGTCYANATPNAFGHIVKPADHQNELSISIGGPISIPHWFDGKDKLFFQATYDKLHSRAAPSYSFNTLPTTQMQNGDFTQLLAVNGGPGLAIYDPTTQAACTANSTNGTCRYQFGYGPGASPGAAGNPVPTGAPVNVIPAGEISPISKYMQQFLPALTNNNLTSNYLGGIPGGYDNYLWAGRIDYDISPRNRLSFAATDGRRHAVPFTSGSANLPPPYLAATLSTVVGSFIDVEDTFTVSPHIVNQFTAGYAYFGGPPTQNNTEGVAQYEATTAGITGLPAGQGSDEFPGVTFAGTDGGTEWSQPDVTSKTVAHTFDIVDNVNWVFSKHSLTFGIQLQDLMANVSTNNSYSSPITYAYSSNDTANISGTSYVTASGGFSYASYLLGAVDSTSVTLQPFSDVGSRYHTVAPYFQDDYKITSKLTLNLGLRWDYMPPFHEVLDRWSFLNATAVNPYTGNPGNFQFAGNYGGAGVSCGCTTPVNTYWKNWGPRLGFSYAVLPKTVIRGSVGFLYSHGGGTGGAGATGTGQTGFNDPVTFAANAASATAAPTFYLNNSATFTSKGLANTNFGGPGVVLPSIPAPSANTQISAALIGNFVNGSGAFVKSSNGVAYADPYYGDRTPTFYFFNFGGQQSLTKDITFTLNYAGSISHFIAGNGALRGLESGEVNPIYFALGAGGTVTAPQYGKGLLTQAATAANVALAQAVMPGCCASPYPGFAAAAATSAGSSVATIAQSLKWMPQYSGTTDTWGLYSANAAYNALQASVAIRPYHGLVLNVNYTWSKEMDDAGTVRSGYPIPASATLTGKAWKADREDRSLSTLDSPQNLAVYGVYKLPFGKGGIGAHNFVVRWLAGGWEFSGILTYTSGYPLTLTSSACTATSLPNQSTCMPDINPNFTGPIMSSKWGVGATALNLGTKSYINNGYVISTTPGNGTNGTTATNIPCGASTGPFCNANPLMFGDAARTGAYGLRTPSNFRLTNGLRRSFPITEQVKFIFGVDCQNVTNRVTFGENVGNQSIPVGINASSYGTLNFASADGRAFQFSGRISF